MNVSQMAQISPSPQSYFHCPCHVQGMFSYWLYHEYLPQALWLLFFPTILFVNKTPPSFINLAEL